MARSCRRYIPRCTFIPINGAAHKVGNTDTPWSYRDAIWSQVIVGVDPDPANKDRITAWAKNYWEALHPYGAGGAYVNFMMEGEGEDRIRATYRDNYDRLARIKGQVRSRKLLPRESEYPAGRGRQGLIKPGGDCEILFQMSRIPDCDRRATEKLEARVRIELTHKGFADLSLTTWVPRPNQ